MVDKILKKFEKRDDNLLPALIALEGAKPEKYISYDEMKAIAQHFNLPLAKVKGVITFYSHLSLKPRGKYIIRVCESLPCTVNGALPVIECFRQELGLDIGGTTYDGHFTLETTSCMGHCARGPSCMINDDVYYDLNEEKIRKLIREYQEK
ncbi:MAG: NAD(P)H-dependent oxidoreductase subunit E [bacterium]|nr:NAD(P)H-dependent oxidoreductase subunit E [bacterium]